MGKRKRKVTLAQPNRAIARLTTGPSFEMPEKAGPGSLLIIEDFAEKSSGTSRRVRNHGEHPLSLAFFRGQLETKYPDTVPDRDRITADERLAAGEDFRAHFERMHRSGRDSLDMSGGGGSDGTLWTQTQAMAIHWVKAIELRMHHRNVAIVRAFCGEGHSMVESLRKARMDFHPNGVTYRIREALDDLVGATTGRKGARPPQDLA
jgi:hypothetical protein